jgi:hypothetical protein
MQFRHLISAINNHRHFSWWLLAFVVAATLLRIPVYITDPRMWAEEGRVFFKYAVEHPWQEVLLKTQMEYYTLLPRLSTLAATYWVELEYAAHITTAFAFVIQLLPYIVVLFGSSPYWAKNQDKLVVIIILLIVMNPMQIWLTTLGSKYHLCLATCMILLSYWKNLKTSQLLLYTSTLFIAALTGPVSCLITPFYVLRALKTRSPVAFFYACIFIAACALHFYIMFFELGSYRVLGPRNFELVHPTFIAGVVSYNITSLFTGTWLSNMLPEYALVVARDQSWLPAWLFTALVSSALISTLWWVGRNLPKPHRYILIGLFAYLIIMITFFSLRSESSIRYGYAPSALFAIILYFSVQHCTGIRRKITLCLLAWCALINLYNFTEYYHRDDVPEWTSWQEEIVQWRANPDYKITVQPPFNMWKFHLYPHRRLCKNCEYKDEFR